MFSYDELKTIGLVMGLCAVLIFIFLIVTGE